MVRNILIVAILCFLGWFGWRQWQLHNETAQLNSGDIVCPDCPQGDAKARFDKENSGDTSDGNSEHKDESARVAGREADLGTGSGATGTSSMVPPSQTTTFAAPSSSPAGMTPARPAATTLPVVPMAGQPVALANSAGVPAPVEVPAHDSEPANAPNGMRFAGAGTYQWYRQGDLTYRIDTATGKSCVLYATKRQWRDPLVYNNGCGKTS